MCEVWKPIPSTCGRYEASSEGRIRSTGIRVRAKNGKSAFRPGRVLAQSTANRRYAKVTLCYPSGRREQSVHRMVAEAWLGEAPEGVQVRHLDGDASNNRPENLAYGTTADNVQDRHRHGRYYVGEKHHLAVLRETDVLSIFNNTNGLSAAMLAVSFGVSESTVYAIRNGHRWTHITKAK